MNELVGVSFLSTTYKQFDQTIQYAKRKSLSVKLIECNWLIDLLSFAGFCDKLIKIWTCFNWLQGYWNCWITWQIA